jgi:DNA-binding response OmpR family regulator
MGKRTLLVVEDEPTIAASVAARLRQEGFEVEVVGDGPSAVAACKRLEPDLVVLDLMLPGFDGLEVCRRIQEDRAVPVLMLTARDSETDVLVGLGMGADDYMTKPFSPRELVARVHAILRRVDRAPSAPNALNLGEIVVDVSARKVTRAEKPVHLTPTEFDLLLHFAQNSRSVFSREQLLGTVWGYAETVGGRTVDSHIRALRRKLGDDIVRTVHGVGYALGDVS